MNAGGSRRILAIGAHPDDVEFGCAGTLAKFVRRGDTVVVSVVCRGDSASADMDPQELAAVRSAELHESMQVLGAELIEMGFPDYGVWPNRENLLKFTDVIRQARPDVVITHFHTDYSGDHNNTFALVLDATVAASVRNVVTQHPAIPRVPLLYMMEPIGGYGFQPQVYVDITETFDVKIAMLNCHKSQIEWMSRYGGFDSRAYVETVARFRGYQAGVALAEGFLAHASFGHVSAGSVLP